MYLALPDSPGRFLQDFTSPVVLKDVTYDGVNKFHIQDYHLLWFSFPGDFVIYDTRTITRLWKETTVTLTTPRFTTASTFRHRSYIDLRRCTCHDFTILGLGYFLFARRY